MSTITVLGAGMAGFGAAHHLKEEDVDILLYDRNPYSGGHTHSFSHEGGWIFDEGPHVSFTKDTRIQDLFSSFVDGEYETIKLPVVNNHWKGHWLKHPAQCNLYGLPTDLVVACLNDFIHAQFEEPGPIHNYLDWLLASYGETFTRTFPYEYTKKYHTTVPENMSIDWLGPRLYRPELKEVLEGALSAVTADVHYVDYFRYPTHGGFKSYLAPLPSLAPIQLNHEVIKIDPREQRLDFKHGVSTTYEQLVSSLPLPDLIRVLADVPDEVTTAASKLAASSCVLVNIGLSRPDFTEANWTYFYDDDFLLTRLSFPHKLSPNTVPDGCGSIQAEIYYSEKYMPLDRSPEECIDPAIADLKRCGLLREDEAILFANAVDCKYGNIIFDLERADALATVNGYLDELGIQRCGRYGEWGYEWTDESFISGEKAAQRALDAM